MDARVLSGRAEVKRAGKNNWRPVDRAARLREGDTLRTGAAGKAELRMGEGHRLSVRQKTTLTVVAAGKDLQYQFKVLAGRVRVLVKKLRPQSHFEIRTPLAVAAVRGTEFEMEVLDQGASRLSVVEGVVAFKDLAGIFNEVSVLKGQSVTIEPNQAPRPPEPVPQEILQEKMRDAAAPPPGPPKEDIEREAFLDGDRDDRQEQGANNSKEEVFQEGKALIDAYGKRVRLDEFVLRPTPKQFAFVAVSRREGRTDATRLDIFAKSPLSDAVDVKGLFYQEGGEQMLNWAVAMQRIATNGSDVIKDWRDGGAPVQFSVGDNHSFSQVVFAHWFVEAGSEGNKPVLLSHWVPDDAYKLGNYLATQSRDEPDTAVDGAQDKPWGYVNYNAPSSSNIIGDYRPIDTNVSNDKRPYYFTDEVVQLKYQYSEGFERTATLILDDAVPFTPDQFLHARKSVLSLNYTNPGTDAIQPALYQTSFRLTDDGRRLNQDDIIRDNLAGEFNFQTVYDSNLFAGRKIDIVTSPSTFRPPNEYREDTKTIDALTP